MKTDKFRQKRRFFSEVICSGVRPETRKWEEGNKKKGTWRGTVGSITGGAGMFKKGRTTYWQFYKKKREVEKKDCGGGTSASGRERPSRKKKRGGGGQSKWPRRRGTEIHQRNHGCLKGIGKSRKDEEAYKTEGGSGH